MVTVVRNNGANIISKRMDRVHVAWEERGVARVEVSSSSRTIHLRVISRTLVEGVHHILVLPRVVVELVPVLEEHVFMWSSRS